MTRRENTGINRHRQIGLCEAFEPKYRRTAQGKRRPPSRPMMDSSLAKNSKQEAPTRQCERRAEQVQSDRRTNQLPTRHLDCVRSDLNR